MINKLVIILFYMSLATLISVADKPCIKRKYNYDSIVCVCDEFYCDEVSKVKPLNREEYVMYTSSLSGDRFVRVYGKMEKENVDEYRQSDNDDIQIIRTKTFQKIIGFGGAFTDAFGANMIKLNENVQNKLINSYFSENGLEYNIGRVPMGATDFSLRRYTYVSETEADPNLKNFSLTTEDYSYKIPIIKKAMKVVTSPLKLTASPWYIPKWMQSRNDYSVAPQVHTKYYKTWANYYIRFFEEYEKENISFAALTLGNEPATALTLQAYQTRAFASWDPRKQGIWLSYYLGPTIRNSKYKNISILALDDQRIFLPLWINLMGPKQDIMSYVDGISVHWYSNAFAPLLLLTETRNQFPYLYMMSNEASFADINELPWEKDGHIVKLGFWHRAEKYIEDLFIELNYCFVGWNDWNLALDMNGGPNWCKNHADAAIIIDAEKQEFLKQPLFYAIGHFSKFIPRDSLRVLVEYDSHNLFKDISHVAFLRPDGGIVVVLYNNNFLFDKKVTITEKNKGFIEFTMKPKSVTTLIYW